MTDQKSYIPTIDEVSGHSHQAGRSISPEGVHRGPMTVSDNDLMAGEPPGSIISNTGSRQDQVDQVAIEYTDGAMGMCPRTLGDEARQGGYAQEGDQSYPASGPRTTAGTRGAADIGKV